MTNLNPEATVIGKIRNVFGNSKLPKANETDNTLKFSISKSQKEANIQIVFDKELNPGQIKEIEKITNGDVNKFFKNIDNVLTRLGITVNEVIVTGYVGKKVSLFPKHAGKVTFKNCTFKDNSQIYIQDNDVTFDGCTFGDGVSIHSLNENANVTIKDSKLPKKIGASVKQEQRILDREKALKFFGKFKGLTLQNNFDEERNGEKILGGLIDAANAEIKDGDEKKTIVFKDQSENLITPKDILKLYGGSLIKKSNLGQELYRAQIEAKKNDLISQNKADTNTSDEEIETHCIISRKEKILRSVSLVDDTFEYEESLKREALPSEKKDKKRALESLEETRKSVAKSAYNEIKLNHKKLMADYKKTLPKVTAQTHDEMNEEEKKSFSKKYEGKISYEKKVKKFFKKQFKKLKGHVKGSNNDTTASCTLTSKSTGTQNSTDSQPTQNNGTQSADAASGTQIQDNGSNSAPTLDPVASNTLDSANGTPTQVNSNQNTDVANGKQVVNQTVNDVMDLDSNEEESDTSSHNGNITDEESTETEEDADAASDEQVASQANDDGTELNSDKEESDTSSNNGNIPDEESTETEEEENKALKNPDKTLDVSAGTSDMENEQKEENNNQETTSSNLMN
ncbi:MAG: hypothetical protein SPJ04_05805 [Bdellovibrionota bacterium]|nr:hypothetical protein [Pseudomonadota bacterium]MDY6090749.1 hypothetical protein [Bdellovibrionota bacterium]